jgi:hypothetical protein
VLKPRDIFIFYNNNINQVEYTPLSLLSQVPDSLKKRARV